jgi:hypothetical protein
MSLGSVVHEWILQGWSAPAGMASGLIGAGAHCSRTAGSQEHYSHACCLHIHVQLLEHSSLVLLQGTQKRTQHLMQD